MMLFKLSVRNIKKSFHDYLIYFATLILGVAIFYVFNALGSQAVMLRVSSDTIEIIGIMKDAMEVVSVFVSFVLGFLIVYASNFLMKRRKKEFGIYMLLGMSKYKISGILIIETVIIGLASLVIGLLLGIVASQGMSIVVANMFEADMTSFHFIVSEDSIVKTILYFVIIYIVVIALDTLVVSSARLISLINSERHPQKNNAKNPVLCILVFVAACVLLGTAYYKVTAGVQEITELSDLGVQIAKGIIGTFMVFWSVSGLLITIVKRCRRFYYKGLNCFSTKELSSRINTTVFSGGIICLLLFLTICILSSAVAIKKASDDVLKKKVPMDIQFIMLFSENEDSIRDYFDYYGVENNLLDNGVTIRTYTCDDISQADVISEIADRAGYSEDYVEFAEYMYMEIALLSDYNRLAAAYGMPEYELDDGEYMIIADYAEAIWLYDMALQSGVSLNVGDMEYSPKYAECKDGFIEMSNAESNSGIIILPDSVDRTRLELNREYYTANYKIDNKTDREMIDQYFSSEEFSDFINPAVGEHPYIGVETKTYLYETSIGMTSMIIFIGIYLGLVFLISGAAILSLKELSEAADNRNKYMILRKLGVNEKQISRSLAAQCGIFFGLPLLLAVIHSIFGMKLSTFILSAFGKTGLTSSIILSAAVILVIYGIYFEITYVCSRRIISE